MQYNLITKRELNLPQTLLRGSLVIYDRKLTLPDTLQSAVSYPVTANEKLKSLDEFPRHAQKLLKLSQRVEQQPVSVVAIGGGTVGDFAGFFSSVFKRGVDLYHVPSTWLAAIDSAHGGKNALNAGGAKNQLGTIYPSKSVFLVRSLLLSQPAHLADQAYYELLKISLINRPDLFQKLNPKGITPAILFRLLPEAIEAKMEIVKKDPFEKQGLRHVLNLGHTMGHVFEAHQGLPHGFAVGWGLNFALIWSQKRGYLKDSDFQKIQSKLRFDLLPPLGGISESQVRRLLQKDKKRVGRRVRFVFLKKPGQVFVEPMTVDAIVKEWNRQRGSY